MSPRYRLLSVVTALVLILDQATKLYVDSRFALHESLPVIEDFFSLTYVRNKGAAFGMLADSPWRVPFFIAVASVASVALIWYLHRTRADQKLLHLGLSLVFSGAVGNLIDRIRLGEVIDFLDVYWRQYHWPAFNVADSAICVGVAILFIEMYLDERNKKRGG